MMSTAIDAKTITPIDHDEAMRVRAVEFDRMLDLGRTLEPDDWRSPTVNTGWDVRAVMLHLLGAAEANASMRENVHQMRHGKRLFKEIGGHHWVDGVNEIQIRDRSTLTYDDALARYATAAPKAVRVRRRIPKVVRSLPVIDFPEPIGRQTLGYLLDMVYTRDVWMHRVDISRATGRSLVLTPDHDGRIVADIVAEWARIHGHAFELELEGPAGGTYRSGTGGEHLTIDAVEFVCVLSGRGSGTGLLAYELPV